MGGCTTNSTNYSYRLTNETVEVVRTISSINEERMLKIFTATHEPLVEMYSSKKKTEKKFWKNKKAKNL